MSASHPFRVGQRVICRDDRFPAAAIPCFHGLPVAGRVYRIAATMHLPDHTSRVIMPSVVLVEHPPVAGMARRVGLNAVRFAALPPSSRTLARKRVARAGRKATRAARLA